MTLEANPTSVEAARLRGYRAAGVNRVSLGVQAMNDADLRALGRLHSAAEAMAAVAIAAIDLRALLVRPHLCPPAARRPPPGPPSWRRRSRRAAEHLSLYQLTIEPGTMFERLRDAGKLVVPDAETARVLYDVDPRDLREARPSRLRDLEPRAPRR